MDFVIGGAYQGKLEHVKNKYGIGDGDVFKCSSMDIDFSKRCIYGIEEFTYSCIQNGVEPLDYFKENEAKWKDSILICQDLFCGVVPLGADLREWRQATGRLCKYLSQQADHVSRIFCGLEQVLK